MAEQILLKLYTFPILPFSAHMLRQQKSARYINASVKYSIRTVANYQILAFRYPDRRTIENRQINNPTSGVVTSIASDKLKSSFFIFSAFVFFIRDYYNQTEPSEPRIIYDVFFSSKLYFFHANYKLKSKPFTVNIFSSSQKIRGNVYSDIFFPERITQLVMQV